MEEGSRVSSPCSPPCTLGGACQDARMPFLGLSLSGSKRPAAVLSTALWATSSWPLGRESCRGRERMLFDYISELSAKLLDAVATRQVGGGECTSNRALIKHSCKMPASFAVGLKKKKCGWGCVLVNTFAAAWLAFPYSHPELLWPYKAMSRHPSSDPGSPAGELSVREAHDFCLSKG